MPTPVVTVRLAHASDAAAVAAIYNEGIAERVATFETRSRGVDEVEAWLADGLPFLVAVDGDVVLGWARLSDYSDRCVYAGVAEHGVYVAGAARGRGVGRRLLEALCEQAAQHGIYKITSRIFSDNLASRAVHRAAGFDEVGIQRRHGVSTASGRTACWSSAWSAKRPASPRALVWAVPARGALSHAASAAVARAKVAIGRCSGQRRSTS